MQINVEESLIEPGKNTSIMIDNQINDLLITNEGQNIKSDIDLLVQMGFDKKMINKVYILLRPENIDRAIEYMTEVDGIYQHDFLSSSNPKEKTLCFICKKPQQNHLDYKEDESLNENLNINNLINNEQESNERQNDYMIRISYDDFIKEEEKYPDLYENDLLMEEEKYHQELCGVCYEKIDYIEKMRNKIPCRHLFCSNCWFNYLKTFIIEAKIDEIKCMDHLCNEIISEKFILKHISFDNDLFNKYQKFKTKTEILKDKNKKICPNPDCESFLEKSELSKYVECEKGHKYCFECLKPPHGDKPSDFKIEKQFVNWIKGKKVKRCPRCKMYTEKNEGCNHMTCASCKYQWCWLCEGQYEYGHYDSGKCEGHQFTNADNLEQVNKKKRKKIFIRNQNYFGLHKIFSHVFSPIVQPHESEACYLDYLLIFTFWLYSVPIIFILTVLEFFTNKVRVSDKAEKAITVFVYMTGFSLFACFQITFSGLITLFILVSFIYYPFFYRFILFFDIGDH